MSYYDDKYPTLTNPGRLAEDLNQGVLNQLALISRVARGSGARIRAVCVDPRVGGQRTVSHQPVRNSVHATFGSCAGSRNRR